MIVKNKQDVIKVLQTHRDKLKDFGVASLGLFSLEEREIFYGIF